MERKFFLETVVPAEFDLGRTEAKNKTPKKEDASPSYHAGYDTPDVLQKTIKAYVQQVATAGYDDAAAGKPDATSNPSFPELKDETNGAMIQGDDPRINALTYDIPKVYDEGYAAPKSEVPPGFTGGSTFKMGKYTFATVGAVGGGLLGLIAGSLLGAGLITKLATTAAGAAIGGLYLESKAPGD